MQVETSAPLAIAVLPWRPRAGQVAATIIVKATFRLEPYVSPLSDDAEPIRVLDEAPFKRTPELLVVGTAHAPGRRPSRSVVARVVFGEVDKTVELWADRAFDADGDGSVVGLARESFSLDYTCAAGGPGTDNPVGRPLGGAIPSMQPRAFVPRRGLPIPTIGLGPIAPKWPGRARRLRAADAEWLRAPMHADAPTGFDASFFSAAPTDQRLVEPIAAETRLELDALHPEHDRLVTYLAKVDPVLLCDEGDVVVPELVADTLVIDAEHGLATLTWRAAVVMPAAESQRRLRLRVEVSPDLAFHRPTTLVPVPQEKPQRLVDLLGFETEIPARIRRTAPLLELLDGASSGDGPPKLDVLRVLASAETSSLADVRRELASSRALELPLFAVAGELTVGFDELEALRVALAVASRLSSSDRRLRGALELAARVVESPVPLSAEGAGALLSQLYSAASQLPFPPGFLESQVDRGLREHRKLKRRHVLGAPHVRAELTIGSDVRAIFVSEAIASHLPMTNACPVVALVEARPGEDMGEAEAEAFVALALGRVVRAASVRPVAA